MTALNKQALREAAVRAGGGKWIYIRMLSLSSAYITEETGETVINCTAGDVPAKCAGFLELANPLTVLAMLDELEAAEERYEDMLRQARSFREAHDSASELIRKLERNKPVVKLPTTKLWAGKVACYEESEIIALLTDAGIGVKGE